MKYALVDEKLKEAQPGLHGNCRLCGALVVPRCGEIRIHHWAHKMGNSCDHWWESETEWYRDWKNRFPIDWQEIILHDERGEKHIADIKTDKGWVVEFQHSAISSGERQSREKFYKKWFG